MSLPIRLLSTDFDGTLFAEFENPPVPYRLQELIGDLQEQGVKWVINTGREMSSLMEAMGRAHLVVKPDFLVLVEREIYFHEENQYVGHAEWNHGCHLAHSQLFQRVIPDVPYITEWIGKRFKATIYEDPYSPFCLIADSTGDAEVIHDFLEEYCNKVPGLVVVRNDVYARFSHVDYNKGTALHELTRRLGISPAEILAAGDHLNDLPMLTNKYARWLVSPSNAVPAVKELVRGQGGFISTLHCGHGVAEGIAHYVNEAQKKK